jgi:hypothetical protein
VTRTWVPFGGKRGVLDEVENESSELSGMGAIARPGASSCDRHCAVGSRLKVVPYAYALSLDCLALFPFVPFR